MSKKRVPLPEEIKRKIITALEDPASVVSELAKEHSVSEGTIHQLRRYHRTQKTNPGTAESCTTGIPGFVELLVKDEVQPHSHFQQESNSLPSVLLLEQAAVVFKDVSLTVEGRVNMADLIGLVKRLGVGC